HPSATTWPWRTSMTLWRESISLSAASTNERTAEDETPCTSGLLRGRSAPRPAEPLTVTRATRGSVFILRPRDGGRNGSILGRAPRMASRLARFWAVVPHLGELLGIA